MRERESVCAYVCIDNSVISVNIIYGVCVREIERERELKDFVSSQAITKQFAEILHFTLSFDDLKV